MTKSIEKERIRHLNIPFQASREMLDIPYKIRSRPKIVLHLSLLFVLDSRDAYRRSCETITKSHRLSHHCSYWCCKKYSTRTLVKQLERVKGCSKLSISSVTFISRQEPLTQFLIWDTMPAFLSCTGWPNAPGQGNVRFTFTQTASVRNLLSLLCKNLIMKDWAQIFCSDKKLLHNCFFMKLISTCHDAKKIHCLHDKNFNYLLAVYKQQYTVNSPETHFFPAWFQSWLAETIVAQ